MTEKEILTRIQHKYDTQTNWEKATGFTPKKGELIIYSDIKKFKVGDGNSKLSALQFYDIDLSSYATKAYVDQAEADALAAAKIYTNGLATNYATAAQGLKADTALQSSDIAAAAKKNVDSSISAGSTSTNLPTSAAVATFVEGKGYTKNTGTVTSVAAGNGLTGGTITGSGTISHADTSSQASVTASGRKYITGVTLDGYGHVTGLTTGTETVTNTNTTYDLAASKNSTNGNVQVNLTAGGSGSGTDSVTIKGSGATTVTTDANGVITISSTDNNTTYSAATQSAAGLMSAADKTKLDGIATGANKTTVDSALSSTSTNPVQNKVVNTAISNLNTLVGDTKVSTQISNAMNSLGSAAYTDTGVDKVFNIFPTEAEINTMSNWQVFKTIGFYDERDGFGCTYIVRDTQGDFYIPYGNKFISPAGIQYGGTRDIRPEWYGIRPGSSTTTYAAENSAIMDKLAPKMLNGYTLSFGSGHYYFSNPLVFSTYTMIKGPIVNATVAPSDVNFGTYLHFPSITNGNAAIALNGGGVVENIGLIGNPSVASVSLNRDYTTTDPSKIITLVDTGTTYGIKIGGGFVVQNVRIRNFTYGVYAPTGNSSISFVDIRQCKIGISVGNDIKISNIQVWNVITGIELRGQLASATNIRGDSVGKHLIECWNGKCLLTNIDGDYCLGSLIHYGGVNKYIHLGQAVACMGRVATKNAYSRSGSFDLTAIPDSDYEYCSYISIAPNTQVFGGQIDVVNVSANPMDTASGYVHPNAVISIGSGSTVKGLIIKCNVPYDADLAYFNRNVIKNISTHAESTNDTNSYLTDFDGSIIEDINFVTPIGFVTSKRTKAVPERQIESTNGVGSIMTTIDKEVPTVNINDNVWEPGYFNADGADYVGSYAAQSFRNVNYIPVKGGETIAIYYDAADWNNNNKGKPMYIVEYDANKNVLVARASLTTYTGGGSLTLNANTAYVRLAFNKWSNITEALTDIKVAIYYIEDAQREYIEPYEIKQEPRVNGDKVVHNTKPVLLSASNWSNMAQTINVAGVTVDNNIVIAPAPTSHETYCETGIYCSAQASGKLTFTCTQTPTSNLTVNIMILG